MRKFKSILALSVVTFGLTLLAIPTKSHADIIDPHNPNKKSTVVYPQCPIGEKELSCFSFDCRKFENDPSYIFLPYSTGSSGVYCTTGIKNPLAWGIFIIVGLILTLLLELPILYAGGFKKKKAIMIIVLANLISFTVFHFLFSYLSITALKWTILAEVIIVIFETLFIWDFANEKNVSLLNTFLQVLIANAISATLGTYIISLLNLPR